MSERETRTVTVPWSGAEATFEAWPEQGAWYEVGHDPSGDEVGFLYAPMQLDGSFDPEEIGEVEFTYAEVNGPPEEES